MQMRVAGVIVTSAVFLATAVPSVSAQEQSRMSPEMRAELRKMIREEIRSAIADLHEDGGHGQAKGAQAHRIEWHGEAGKAHGLVAKAHGAHGAHSGNDFVFERDDEDVVKRFKAHAQGDGKGHKTFSIPGGKGKVMFMHDNGEVEVDVRVETDGEEIHKTFTIPGHGKGHGKGNVMFVHKGDNGATCSVKSGGNVELKSHEVKWFDKGNNVKTFSIPGGKGQIFLHKGDGKVFDVKANRVINERCCDDEEECCEAEEKSEAECPHAIEVHREVKHAHKNIIHI